MPYQIAMKFKYIHNCIEYGDYSYIYEDGMKIKGLSRMGHAQMVVCKNKEIR